MSRAFLSGRPLRRMSHLDWARSHARQGGMSAKRYRASTSISVRGPCSSNRSGTERFLVAELYDYGTFSRFARVERRIPWGEDWRTHVGSLRRSLASVVRGVRIGGAA